MTKNIPRTSAKDKREKTYREHLDDTLREGIPEDMQRFLDEL